MQDTGELQPVVELAKPETESTGKLQKVMQLSSAQKKVVAVGLVIIAIMGLFPPWRATIRHDGSYRSRPCGYSFILISPGSASGFESVQIDFSRLILQWLVVTAVFGAIFFWVPDSPC